MIEREGGVMSSTARWRPNPDGQQTQWDGEFWIGHFAPRVPPVTPAMPTVAPSPQHVLPELTGQGLPPNRHLTWAWISTLLFCWPLGIPAVVCACRVNKKWAAGDVWGARQDSQRAQTFATLSMTFGVALWLCLLT